MSFVVAIDGPAAAGKGTVAKAVAAHFGFAHLDTGLLYRAVARQVLNGLDPIEAACTLIPAQLKADDLRTAKVAQEASKVAVIPEVRSALVDFQRGYAQHPAGAVLDGRDIGTVICPDADIKLFVTASPEVRAERRWKELTDRGDARLYEEVLADVRSRDARDSSRAEAPLKPAGDAVSLDTSAMGIEEAVETAIRVVAARRISPEG
jgi:cytidylate kinase